MTVTHGAPRHDQETRCNYTADVHDRGDNTVTLDDRNISCGPRCRSCKTTEAQCAWREGCCDRCTHFGPRLFLIASTGGRPRTSCDDCRLIRRTCTHRLTVVPS